MEVSAAAKKLLGGRLTKRAIVTLIKDYLNHPVSRRNIEAILDAAAGISPSI